MSQHHRSDSNSERKGKRQRYVIKVQDKTRERGRGQKREGGERVGGVWGKRDMPYLGRRGVGGALDWQDPRNGLSGTVK